MKNLPNNLQNLIMNLFDNNLGKNIENIKYFGIAMKQLP